MKAWRWWKKPRAISTAAGREESRGLPRKAAMLYAGESMRVTTRLMQAASWLLVQRAVHDGDMEADAAAQRPLSPGLQGNLPGQIRRRRRKPARRRCAICWSAATISIAASRGWTMCCSARREPAARRARGQLDALAQAFGASSETKKAAHGPPFVFAQALSLHKSASCALAHVGGSCDVAMKSVRISQSPRILVEAGQAAAAVHQLLLAAGPGRVGLGSMSSVTFWPASP